MAKKNKQHVFTFKNILETEINQKNWNEKKQQLQEQFGKFKVALETDLAEAEAQKILDMFNEKLNLQLNVEQFKKDAAGVKKIIENALASLNNIDTSALKKIEDTLEGIAETTSKIFDHMEQNADKAFKNIGQGAQKAAKKTIASVSKIDAELAKLGGNFTEVQNVLDFEITGSADKQLKALRLEQEKLNRAMSGDNWLEQQKALVRFMKAYESYQAKVKGNEKKIPKELSDLYHANTGKAGDAEINLRHIIDRHDKKWSGETSGSGVSVDTSKLATEDTLKTIANKLDNLKVNDGGGDKPHGPQKQPKDSFEKQVANSFLKDYKVVFDKYGNTDKLEAKIDELISRVSSSVQIKDGFDLKSTLDDATIEGWSVSELAQALKGNIFEQINTQPAAQDGATVSIDEATLGNAIANALKGVQLNTNTQGEVKASIDITELKGALHDGTPYEVKDVGDSSGEKPATETTLGEIKNVLDGITNRLPEENANQDIVSRLEQISTNIGKASSDISSNMQQDLSAASQTIVEIVSQQGNAIVEAIKILLPENSFSGTTAEVSAIDENEAKKAFDIVTKEIVDTRLKSKIFFEQIKNGTRAVSDELKSALQVLKILDDNGNFIAKIATDGARNHGVEIAENVVMKHDSDDIDEARIRAERQKAAQEAGANIAKVIEAKVVGWSKFELQTRLRGENLSTSKDFVGATNEQIDKLIADLHILAQNGLYPEFTGNNVLFDKEKGFSLLDLETSPWHGDGSVRSSIEGLIQNLAKGGFAKQGLGAPQNEINGLIDRIKERFKIFKPDNIQAQTPTQDQTNKTRTGLASEQTLYSIKTILESMSKEVGQDQQCKTVLDSIKTVLDGIKNSLQTKNSNQDIINRLEQIVANTNNLPTSIKEALYAGELANSGYSEITDADFNHFFGLYRKDIDEWMDNATGAVFRGREAAQKEFDDLYKGRFARRSNGYLDVYDVQDKDAVLGKLAQGRLSELDADNQELVRVGESIVQIITEKGNEIVSAIKILIPGDGVSSSIDYNTLLQSIVNEFKASGLDPYDYADWESILNQSSAITDKLKELLTQIALIDKSGKPNFKVLHNVSSFANAAVIGDENAVIARETMANWRPNKGYTETPKELIPLMQKAKEDGAKIARILGFVETSRGSLVEIQERAPGKNVANDTAYEWSHATTGQIKELINSILVMVKNGVYPELNGSNIMYDKKKGFTFIDMFDKDSADAYYGKDISDPNILIDKLVEYFNRRQTLYETDERQDAYEFTSKFIEALKSFGLSSGLANANLNVVKDRMHLHNERPKKYIESEEDKKMPEGERPQEQKQSVFATEKTLSSIKTTLETMAKEPEQEQQFKIAPDSIKAVLDGIKVLTPKTDTKAPWATEATLANGTNKKLEEVKNALKGMVMMPEPKTSASSQGASIPNSGAIPVSGAVGKIKVRALDEEGTVIFQKEETTTTKTANAIKTQKNVFKVDENGDETFMFAEIIEDFDKLTKEQETEEKKIKTAKAKLNEFITQFKNKTQGQAENISGFGDVVDLLDPEKTTWNLDTIETAKQKMLALNAEFNTLTQNFRKGSSSLNPFVNAINNSDKLRSQIKNIELDFTSLKDAPDELTTTVAGLSSEFNNAQQLLKAGKIKEYSEAYGLLREKMVKVVNEIRVLRKEQGVQQKSMLFDEDKEVAITRSDTQVAEWEKMSYIPDELRTEFRALHSELNNVIDKDELSIWKKQWEQIKIQITALRREHDGMEKDLKEVYEIYKQIGVLDAKIEGSHSDEERAIYQQEIAALQQKAEELAEEYRLNLQLAEIEKVRADAKRSSMVKVDASQARKSLNAEIKEARKQARVNAANTKWNAGKNALESLWIMDDVDLNKIPQVDLLQKKLDELSKTQRLVNEEIQKFGKSNHIEQLKKQTQGVAQLTAGVKDLVNNYERLSGDNTKQIGQFVGGGDDWEEQITAAIQSQFKGAKIKDINYDTKEVTYEVKEGARAFTQYTAAIRSADDQIRAVKGNTKKLPSFLDGVKKKLGEISQYFSAMSLISRATQELRKGIQHIREIDIALTELKKVTDETEETYDKFLDTAAKIGARLGTTISAVTEATATFAKLGYSMEQATEMAESAIVYKNVGDNIASTEDAADSIISTMKGFRLEASESMAIVDRFNEVGNRFAITSKGIGEALRLSASALSEGGNSLDESIGLITAANEVVNDPSSVGTALKTLTLRLRGSKTELEEMGEDVSDMATTTSQLQAKLLALTGGQVDIMLDANTFKNSTQILREMAEAWEDMTDIQRASALELMGGKRQANVLSALIQNFDTVEDVIETSANSAGSALKENERYLDSIQGKIDQFNNAMQAMWSDTLDSDVVKTFVNLATELVKIVDAVGPLNVALVGLFTFIEAKYHLLGNMFKPAGDGVEELKKQLVKAEEELAKATQADMQHGNKKTAQNRRDAEERVAILKSKIQESSSEAVLDGIDESFDPSKVKKSIGGKKGAITKRAKQLESDGKTFAEIQEDPKIKQWTQEVKDGEQALDEYNAKVAQADAALKQKNVTTAQAAGAERVKAGAEAADASATNAGMAADIAADVAQKKKTASTWADVWAEMTRTGATGASVLATLKQVIATKLASSALVQKGLAIMGVTAAEGASIPVTTMLAGGFVGLASSIWSAITAMWTFMTTTPIGWILLAVGAVVSLGAAFAAIHKSTAELKEELDGFKSELSDIRSELDEVNSELETTSERMSELLAKDKLTFEEQEELDRLRATNDELERRKELLETDEEYKSGLVGRQAAKVVDSKRNEIGWWLNGKSVDEEVLDDIDDYREIKDNLDNASSLEELKKYQEQLDEKGAKIDEYISFISEALDGVEYGDSEESDAALDYLAELQDTYGIARGSAGAKTNAIKGLFNKDEFAETKTAIDGYVDALAKGDTDAKNSITNIIKSNKDLVQDLEKRGLEAQDAIDYFTKLGSEANYATLDGKIKEVGRAATTFKSLLGGDLFKVDNIDIGLAELFDEEGKIIQTKLSQVFNDTSDQTRKDITYLLEGSYEQIKNGTVNVERLLSGFALKTTQQVLEIQNKILGEQNLELFPNLKDEIDGIIDKFSEFSAAVGSVVDALDTLEQARAEEAYSGSISIETLENLMKYTDDYAKLVEIDETGAIRLSADAEKILIEQRIQKIQTDAAAAVQTAQTNLEQAKYNAKAVNETGPVQEALTAATDGLAGAWAYLGSIIGDIKDGNFSGIFERASAAYGNVTAGREKKRAQVNISVEDAEEALANALNQQKIANALNGDNVKSKYSSSEASGGTDNPEDAAQKQREEAWEELLKKYQRELDAIAHEKDLIQAEIDEAEAKGFIASEQYYNDLIALEQEEKASLIAKQKAMQDFYDANSAAMSADEIDEWNSEMRETALAIKEAENNMIEFGNTIEDIKWEYFENVREDIDGINEEIEFMHSLLEDEPVADENGNWSNEALTRLGLYTQQMEEAAYSAQDYQQKIDELNASTTDEEKNSDRYRDKLAELVDGQREAINSYEDAKDGIVELNEARVEAIKEGIEKEIEAYNDLLDVKREELDAERDLYDFKKNIEEQNKSIADTERKLAALSGSTAAEDVAERRRLEAQLVEQKGGLNDTYYDHSMSAQQNALDEEGRYFEEAQQRRIESLEAMLENTEELIVNSMMDVMLNADTVHQTLNEQANTYGVTLSKELTQPWLDASAQAIAWRDELKKDMTEGEWATMIGEGGAITAFSNGVATKLGGSWDTAKTKAKAYSDFLTGAELKKNFSGAITTFVSYLQKIVDKWDEIRKAANAAVSVTPTVPSGGYTGGDGSGGGGGGGKTENPPKKETPKTKAMHADGQLFARTTVPTNLTSTHKTVGGVTYVPIPGTDYYVKKSDAPFGSAPYGTKKYKYYAKGTPGTTKDEWAIDSEPQFGDELVLVPTKDGTLSYMRKNTGVLTADLTKSLMEIGAVGLDGLMTPKFDSGINVINNAINKPEYNFSFDALVKAEKVTEETMPALQKMVTQELDKFAKKLQYSIRGVGGR